MRFSYLVAALTISALLLPACEPPPQLIPQDIHVAQDLIDFGMVPTGGTETTTVRIHNAGDAKLVFSLEPELIEESSGDAFTLEAGWVEIEPRSYQELTVTYTPTAEEDSYAWIPLWSNDPDEANRVIVVMGSSFAGYPQVYVTPPLVEYGFVAAGNSRQEVVEIWNTGEVEVEVLSVSVGGSESLFEVIAEPEYPVPAGGKALVPVQFNSEGGEHEIASLTVEVAGAMNPYYVVNLSANSPGSTNNSPPQINILDPTEPKLFYLYQDLYIEARAFDAQQPNIGLYCTLESSQLGLVEQNTSDPSTSIVEFIIDIDDSDFEDALGLHTMTICCTDVFNETSCQSLVVTVDVPVSENDADGDGYDVEDGDCDDTNPFAYPDAIELADNADNDCDGTVDEGSENSDDDGDTYSEADGDCDDGDAAINPAAEEEADFLDNNCNGTIDEGTVNFDDDFDGFSEALGDCNDDDPEIYTGASEWCDLKDNDCDGSTDEDCIDNTPPLLIVGGLIADRVAVKYDEEVELNVTVISGEDADLVFNWNADGGEFDSTDGPTAVWRSPQEQDEYNVYVHVVDNNEEDLEAWAFLGIAVSQTSPVQPINQPGTNSCQSNLVGGGAPRSAALVGLASLVLWIRRRR